MFGSAIGFVNMAAGERCIVANAAVLVTDGVRSRLVLECCFAYCLPVKVGVGERRTSWERNVAGDRVVWRYRRSGAASYADLCRSKADDHLPNALLVDM